MEDEMEGWVSHAGLNPVLICMKPSCIGRRGSRRGASRRRLGVCMVLAAFLLAGCAGLPKDVQRPVSHALAQPGTTMLGQLAEKERPKAALQDSSGFALLASPNMAYSARFALTQHASRTLDIQYYSIHVDPTVVSLLREVRSAAHRGVRADPAG